MSEFFSVVNEFEELIERFDFKQPKKLWYPHLVALSKHIEDVFYCYVIARVYKHDGSLRTTMWVGPVDRPDDGLDSLSAHIKVDIGYTQLLDENFFLNCQKKIINLIEEGALTSLLASSRKELASPSVKNKRYEVYTHDLLPFFKQIVEATGNDKKVLGSKKKCEEVIEKEFSKLKGEQKAFFEKLGIKSTKEMIWELCYIYSL
ncbi:Imm25 family immunity protein [Chitinophaga arvensicola]|uniref:Immunity protein 25 n=1 Tax=Chitinophaga arvensicola TaxID=29529 RepID=A0A1I0SC15_9BACT|nr:Imm25 family immunity protein [Chitinophaga arvensicola]SEW54494.1 Immunity protein 25 [Chitinophaga arvensicola]